MKRAEYRVRRVFPKGAIETVVGVVFEHPIGDRMVSFGATIDGPPFSPTASISDIRSGLKVCELFLRGGTKSIGPASLRKCKEALQETIDEVGIKRFHRALDKADPLPEQAE